MFAMPTSNVTPEIIRRSLALKIVAAQFLWLLIAAGLTFSLFSQSWAVSFTVGALISVLANSYFAFYAFRHMASGDGKQALSALSKGEFGKIAIVLVGFAWVFTSFKHVNPALLLIGFIVTLVFNWVVSSYAAKQLEVT